MRLLLGTSAVPVASSGRERLLIQNLGPGVVYFNTEGSVSVSGSADAGIRIEVGGAYEFASPSGHDDVSLVSSAADTDVRIVRVG